MSSGVTTTEFANGPFVIVVTDPSKPDDPAYPMVVSPPGGYPDKESALRDIEPFATRTIPYLGLRFHIAQLRTPDSFGRFCSWEE